MKEKQTEQSKASKKQTKHVIERWDEMRRRI